MDKKKKSWLLIAAAVALVLVVVLALTQCKGEAPDWKEQYDLGLRYLNEGNYEEAILAFSAAIEIDPYVSDIYLGRGDAYTMGAENLESQGNYEKAEEYRQKAEADYNKALELDPENENAAEKLDELLGNTSEEEEESQISVRGTLVFDKVELIQDSAVDTQAYPGAEGMLGVSFIVAGPETVCDAYVVDVSREGYTQEQIDSKIAQMEANWDEIGLFPNVRALPFSNGGAFEVYPEDRGTNIEVFVVGVDENMDVAAYAVITVLVPGEIVSWEEEQSQTVTIGPLTLSEFSYFYNKDSELKNWNEGSDGALEMMFTVLGPENVCGVRIASWSAAGFTQAEINSQIEMMGRAWKTSTGGSLSSRVLPYEDGGGFPVYPQDHGSTVDVLLLGLNESYDIVGYAIVSVDIP